jgi:hypothetical protein
MQIALVVHFNAFTGKLQSGYLMNRTTKRPIGAPMTPAAVLAYMTANPDARVDPLKV